MGTDRNRQRLENAESALMPREIVASWIKELAKFDSLADYAHWVADEFNPDPLSTLLQQIQSGSGGRTKEASRKLLRQRSSEVVFLFHVVLRANEHLLDLLNREAVRAAAIAKEIQRVSERVYFGTALWSALNNQNFFSSRNPERRKRREKVASLIRALAVGSKDSELEDSLQRCRADICRLLIEVRATIGATERLTARYFSGLKIPFKSDANALNDLAANITLVANYYNGLADDFAANELGTTFDTGFTGRLEKIDQKAADLAVEEAAATLTRRLTRLAKADALWFFNDRSSAAEVLRPLISAENGRAEEQPDA